MNDDYGLVVPVFIIIGASILLSYAFGFSTGETFGKDKGIAYCMEQPKNCAIEYTYMKLKEKSK